MSEDDCRRLGINARVVAYIEEMASAYRWAGFAITCAGAITLAELAAAALSGHRCAAPPPFAAWWLRRC